MSRGGQDPGGVRHGGEGGSAGERRSSPPGPDGSGQTEQSDGGGTALCRRSYFDTARLNRQQSRDSALALLQEAAGKESADQTLKDEANASIQTMADYTVTEAQIENLVIAKGYTDCVAFIGENALSLAVAAPEGGLTDADTARIVDVVNQTAGFSADQVKIIAVEEWRPAGWNRQRPGRSGASGALCYVRVWVQAGAVRSSSTVTGTPIP